MFGDKYKRLSRLSPLAMKSIHLFMFLANVFDLYEKIYCKIKNYYYGSGLSKPYGHRSTKKSSSEEEKREPR